MLAACLMLFEYLRGFVATGFPWNAISYAALFDPVTMQSASVVGIYGLTAFVVLVAVLPACLLNASVSSTFKRYVTGLLWLVLVTLHVGYGVWRLDHKETEFVEGVNLRLVQPAIAQAEKFDPSREAEFFKRYLDLSATEKDGTKTLRCDASHMARIGFPVSFDRAPRCPVRHCRDGFPKEPA